MKQNHSRVINPPTSTLDIDPAEIEQMQVLLSPTITPTIPNGYYTVLELSKILKLSRSVVDKRIRNLVENSPKKVDVLIGYTSAKSGLRRKTSYYKLIT